jgi:hypothetical protein
VQLHSERSRVVEQIEQVNITQLIRTSGRKTMVQTMVRPTVRGYRRATGCEPSDRQPRSPTRPLGRANGFLVGLGGGLMDLTSISEIGVERFPLVTAALFGGQAIR